MLIVSVVLLNAFAVGDATPSAAGGEPAALAQMSVTECIEADTIANNIEITGDAILRASQRAMANVGEPLLPRPSASKHCGLKLA